MAKLRGLWIVDRNIETLGVRVPEGVCVCWGVGVGDGGGWSI